LDERLAEARDEVLLAGESVIAQECGDQGQAVVVTDLRLIILKAGIMATGMLNGRKTGAFPFQQIKTVSVRKGHMGAVIHVSGDATGSDDERPENLVMFSGSDKVKRCDAIAAKIESALGRPVERIEPGPELAAEQTDSSQSTVVSEPAPEVSTAPQETKPPKGRGGRVAKSLAEEMYGDTSATQSVEPVAEEPAVIELESALDFIGHGIEQTSDEPAFGPNPFIPKPRRRPGSHPDKVMIVVVAMLAVVLLGVAVIAPMRRQADAPVIQLDVKQLTGNPSLHRHQYIEISGYRKRAAKILKASDTSAAAVRAAIGSGSHQAVVSTLKRDVTGDVWNRMDELDAPLGLAGAKESIVSGLFIRKSAVEAAMTGSVSSTDTIRKLNEANARIAKGLAAMDRMLNALKAEISRKK
jgi:hypothetical protein